MSYPDHSDGWCYAVHSVGMVVEYPDSEYRAFKVFPIKISETGIALLLGDYVQVNSKCAFFLPTVSGEVERVTAVVAECFRQQEDSHNVSAAFDEEIDLNRYLASDDCDD